MALVCFLFGCSSFQREISPDDPRIEAQTVHAIDLKELSELAGRWYVRAENPRTGGKFTLQYVLTPILGGRWVRGVGQSEELMLQVEDLWGKDPVTGDLLRVVFDSSGTYGELRSKGWDNQTLTFLGNARSKEHRSAIGVKLTMTRVSPDELKAVWQSQTEDGWSTYSNEVLTRIR
jgi:hypothetical protein